MEERLTERNAVDCTATVNASAATPIAKAVRETEAASQIKDGSRSTFSSETTVAASPAAVKVEAEVKQVVLAGGENEADAEGAPAGEAARWPDEISEAAFLAEQPGAGPSTGIAVLPAPSGASPAIVKAVAEPKIALPPLQELVDRITPETREVLEDLFRARFVGVKRIQKEALKVE